VSDPADRDDLIAELDKRRLGGILYPGNAGCAGTKLGSAQPLTPGDRREVQRRKVQDTARERCRSRPPSSSSGA
jgi:hypothetical protein